MADPRTLAEPLRDSGTAALLRSLIRNACVNDGTAESGQEVRSVDLLRDFLAGSGLRHEVVEPAPGRASLVARIRGTDPGAPSLALVGHLDVVPADERSWSRDPFGGELVDGEIWGRGAVDMLGLTASMAVVTRELAASGRPLRGDLVLAAVADEEAGGRFGTGHLVADRPDLIRTDYALTENGGLVLGSAAAPGITVTVGEKGGAPRTLEVRGRAGHGSTPWGARNAAGIAAQALTRLLDAPGTAVVHDFWRRFVGAYDFPDPLRARLTDPASVNAALAELGALAGYAHALTHLTVSPNIVSAGAKRNVVPGNATIELDIRVLPGQDGHDVDAHLRHVLGGLLGDIEIHDRGFRPASASPVGTALYESIAAAVSVHHPGAELVPVIMPGGTDGKHLRAQGTVVYGFGLYSPRIGVAEFRRRFHGDDERVDIESVELTTAALRDTVLGLLG